MSEFSLKMKSRRRKIVKVDTVMEQHTHRGGWWQIDVNTVHLECGHTKIYRSGHPKKHVWCKQCGGWIKGAGE